MSLAEMSRETFALSITEESAAPATFGLENSARHSDVAASALQRPLLLSTWCNMESAANEENLITVRIA
jgi:hypothetical protein